jgi:DNA-directed RNA polymerase subunit RPC12/RpoP
MGMKTIYNCDICRDEIKGSKLFGVHFSDLKKFTLGNFGCTEGVHICIECAKQLKTHLNNLTLGLEKKEPDAVCFGCGYRNKQCQCKEQPEQKI